MQSYFYDLADYLTDTLCNLSVSSCRSPSRRAIEHIAGLLVRGKQDFDSLPQRSVFSAGLVEICGDFRRGVELNSLEKNRPLVMVNVVHDGNPG